ncbi:MAG: DUF4071 domain-containing protein [Magnetococcales bacterium]|nr:DUF4071 domain-containing protein [Magnetococcales bacterium]
MKPLCFVLMPHGTNPDDSGLQIDFELIYKDLIFPAIKNAGMEPIRSDRESAVGVLHKTMFERLMLCDYAIADITSADVNVYYNLGIRHGARPHSTVLIYSEGSRLPLNVANSGGFSYRLDNNGLLDEEEEEVELLTERLNSCRNPKEDSPLFQMLSQMPRPDISHLKTDLFRDQVEYSNECKNRLSSARRQGLDAILKIEQELNIVDIDPGVVVDLFLSFRAVSAWQNMVDLVANMPTVVANSVLVQEQLALALNRLGRSEDAIQILTQLINEYGPNSETNGILGRVYKDLWEKAYKAENEISAKGYLKRAIDTYLAGFESDWRDAYPGINAVTLMELSEPVDKRQAELLPVVRYAVKQRLLTKVADYWDYATIIELSVLANDQETAIDSLPSAVIAIRESWEPETTVRNLRLIQEARSKRGEDVKWIAQIVIELMKKA